MWKTRDFPRKMIYKWWVCHIYVGLHESVNVNMIMGRAESLFITISSGMKIAKMPYFMRRHTLLLNKQHTVPHLTLSQEPTSNIHQFLKVIEDGLPLLAQSISIPVSISRCIAHSLHLLLGFH